MESRKLDEQILVIVPDDLVPVVREHDRDCEHYLVLDHGEHWREQTGAKVMRGLVAIDEQEAVH